jgi:hypothetical protein
MLQDFHPSSYYNHCFPPSKVIQEWFSHHSSRGHSVTIDIPQNLYKDNNWMGLALCATFSMGGDPKTILDNWVSEIPHFLHCQLIQTNAAGLNDDVLACRTSRTEIMWLNQLGGFIWISYVPGEPFKNMLRRCSHIEASFVSDWPGVTVQECALRLLYQRDQVQFEHKLKQCHDLISQFMADQEKRNMLVSLPDLATKQFKMSFKNFNYCNTSPKIPSLLQSSPSIHNKMIKMPSTITYLEKYAKNQKKRKYQQIQENNKRTKIREK